MRSVVGRAGVLDVVLAIAVVSLVVVKAVNELADDLKEGVKAILDWLGKARKAALRREDMDKELDRQLEEERAKSNGVLRCSTFQHPFEFDGVEAVEMKRDREDQVRMLLKHTMEERGMQLHSPSIKSVLAQFPLFVDLYVELGMHSVHLRPLNPYGFALETWSRIGYSAEE